MNIDVGTKSTARGFQWRTWLRDTTCHLLLAPRLSKSWTRENVVCMDCSWIMVALSWTSRFTSHFNSRGMSQYLSPILGLSEQAMIDLDMARRVRNIKGTGWSSSRAWRATKMTDWQWLLTCSCQKPSMVLSRQQNPFCTSMATRETTTSSTWHISHHHQTSAILAHSVPKFERWHVLKCAVRFFTSTKMEDTIFRRVFWNTILLERILFLLQSKTWFNASPKHAHNEMPNEERPHYKKNSCNVRRVRLPHYVSRQVRPLCEMKEHKNKRKTHLP